MSSNIINEDLRSKKTKKALYDALFSLLKSLNFRKLTIKEICEEAMISRATFYAHFIDKYDLLQHWVTELWPKEFSKDASYAQIEALFSDQIQQNALIFKNLFINADSDTVEILFNFLLTTIDLTVEKENKESYLKHVVLAHFYAGGILSYFLWQTKNKFPSDVPPINKYLYEIIHELQRIMQTKEESGGSF